MKVETAAESEVKFQLQLVREPQGSVLEAAESGGRQGSLWPVHPLKTPDDVA